METVEYKVKLLTCQQCRKQKQYTSMEFVDELNCYSGLCLKCAGGHKPKPRESKKQPPTICPRCGIRPRARPGKPCVECSRDYQRAYANGTLPPTPPKSLERHDYKCEQCARWCDGNTEPMFAGRGPCCQHWLEKQMNREEARP